MKKIAIFLTFLAVYSCKSQQESLKVNCNYRFQNVIAEEDRRELKSIFNKYVHNGSLNEKETDNDLEYRFTLSNARQIDKIHKEITNIKAKGKFDFILRHLKKEENKEPSTFFMIPSELSIDYGNIWLVGDSRTEVKLCASPESKLFYKTQKRGETEITEIRDAEGCTVFKPDTYSKQVFLYVRSEYRDAERFMKIRISNGEKTAITKREYQKYR